ncbi:MAG: DUF1003 domain-containing protein [bacterium]|nr:DUF1003 domain-containing protein [bacterium]
MITRLIGFGLFGGSLKNQPEKNEIPTEDVKTTRARQEVIESIEARLGARRTFGERFADVLVKLSGNFSFAILHILAFAAWIIINLGFVPDVPAFDPYPFNLLTMTVSLEAIFLSIFVLISQNRETKTSDLRQEVDLQVNMIAEREITKLIHLVAYLMKHLNVPYEKDPELKHMMKPLDTEEIRSELERQLGLPHQQK